MTRVIAGVAKGRRLQVPSGSTTRPTSDRAREGLFSSLLSLVDVEGARVLDLYAGSGALGLEAVSRGAASATLVEDDPDAVAALRANVALLGLPGTYVVAQPVERFLGVASFGAASLGVASPGVDGLGAASPALAAEPRYDLAMLDPPYDVDVAPVLVALLPWLVADAIVVVERRSRGPELEWPKGYESLRSRRYGEATLWYGALGDGALAPRVPC